MELHLCPDWRNNLMWESDYDLAKGPEIWVGSEISHWPGLYGFGTWLGCNTPDFLQKNTPNIFLWIGLTNSHHCFYQWDHRKPFKCDQRRRQKISTSASKCMPNWPLAYKQILYTHRLLAFVLDCNGPPPIFQGKVLPDRWLGERVDQRSCLAHTWHFQFVLQGSTWISNLKSTNQINKTKERKSCAACIGCPIKPILKWSNR